MHLPIKQPTYLVNFSKYTILNTVIKYSCSNSGNSGKINNSEQNESETAKSVNITN